MLLLYLRDNGAAFCGSGGIFADVRSGPSIDEPRVQGASHPPDSARSRKLYLLCDGIVQF